MTQAATIQPLARLDYSVPESVYHGGAEVSFSTLKRALKSPLHYRHARDHGREDTPSLRLGRLVHVATLQPDRIGVLYRVWEGARRGREWTLFEAETPAGIEIVTASEMATATAIRDAVRSSRAAMRYLGHGDGEVSCYWDRAGTALRGRFDWLTDDADGAVIIDLKTAQDVGERGFGIAAHGYRYPMQCAMYQEGYLRATSAAARSVLITVESDEPHDVVVYRVPEDVVEIGQEQFERALSLVRSCESFGDWPGQCREERDLVLPRWAYPDEDEDSSGLGLTSGGVAV